MRVTHHVGDHEGLRTLAHTVKGTAASFGAARLAHLAGALERAATERDGSTVAELLEALEGEVSRTGGALTGYRLALSP